MYLIMWFLVQLRRPMGNFEIFVFILQITSWTWVRLQTHSTASLLTPGYGKGITAFICKVPNKDDM